MRHAATVAIGLEIEAVPPRGSADDVDPPDRAIPRAQAKAKGAVSEQRLTGDEGERIGAGGVLSPIANDVAREAVAIPPAPARFDPGADALDGCRDAPSVDVSDGLHEDSLRTPKYGPTNDLVNTVPYG